jgi:putative phosphoesterase
VGGKGQVVRIGVVADTHCPEFLDRLPDRVGELLDGVDLILHAGDITGAGTLAELGRIAPVEAVLGDHDRGLDLPERRLLQVGGRRIGLVHGNRSHLVEEPATLIGTLSLGLWWPTLGLDQALRRAFPDADVVVYGHTHHAASRRRGGTLLFNPGPVYLVTRAEAERRLRRGPGWFEWSWLQVIRHRRDRPSPSVGLLEIGPTGITASILLL